MSCVVLLTDALPYTEGTYAEMSLYYNTLSGALQAVPSDTVAVSRLSLDQ